MTEGGDYWAWYIPSVGPAPLVPLGVYDHPPDADFAPIRGTRVGGSRAVKLLARGTKIANEVGDFLHSITPFP